MLSKIFGFKGKKRSKAVRLSDSSDDSWLEDFHITERGLPVLERSKIRVLIFKDHDRKGDKCVLFDLQTARKNDNQQDTEQKRRVQRRSSSDAALLGEMIFGSVEMTYKGPTVKAHSIRTPPQLLLTKVFALKPHRSSHSSPTTLAEEVHSSCKFSESVKSELSVSQSTNSGFTDSMDQQIAKSVPVSIKSDSACPNSYKLQNVLEDCNSSVSGSNNSLNATLALTSSGSYQRRWLRSQVTRMDYMCERRNEIFNEEMSMRLRRRPKIGIGILFSLWEGKDTSEENNRLFQNFCFSHFPVIESHVHRLKRKVEKALLMSFQNPTISFQDAVLNASNAFCDNILELYYAPRIRSPVWLTMLSQPDQCYHICEDLVPQLVNLIQMYNTKDTNFFMASLLTAVLTYHVAWVTTVTPSCVQARRAYLDKHSSEILNVLGVSHPYNPLWAQLSDLYGAGGDPTKLARTVILGKDKNLVTLLLHILTYFIRCSEVYEQPEDAPVFTKPSPLCSDNVSVDSENVFEISENIAKDCENLSENCKHVSKEFSKDSDGICEDFEDLSCTKEKNVQSISKSPSVDSLLKKTLCEHCNKISNNEESLEDCVLVNRTFDVCNCSDVFNGNSKENKLWKSFLRTSCFDRSCRNVGKDAKWSKPSTKCVTLDDSWLSKTRNSPQAHQMESKLSRRHSSELNSHQKNIFCIQNDGKTISLDKQSILTMFQSSFPFCPICQGKLSFIERDFVCTKEEDTLDCALGKFSKCNKSCSCEMINNEPNEKKFGSCITMNSEGYSSGVSLDIEQESLDNISLDSGLNLQCSQLTASTVGDKCSVPDQPYMLELPGFHCAEIGQDDDPNNLGCQLFSFGRSLMAGYCDKYLPDFVLHGTENCTEEEIKYDLKISLEQPAVDSPVLESVVIIGDTDKWECKVTSLQKPKKGLGNNTCSSSSKKNERSFLVHSFLTSFCDLWDMNMSAQFCLMHLEDKMKEIFLKSKVISEYLLTQKKYVTMNDLVSTFGYSECDIVLLMSVIGVHSPTAVSRIPLL